MSSKLLLNVITSVVTAMIIVGGYKTFGSDGPELQSRDVAQARALAVAEAQLKSPAGAAQSTSPIYHADDDHFLGFGRYLGGYCQLVFGKDTEAEAVAFLEDSVGTRVADYRPFADGLIVTFRNGFESVVWAKRSIARIRPMIRGKSRTNPAI